MAEKNNKPTTSTTTATTEPAAKASVAEEAKRERFSVKEKSGGIWTTDSPHAAYDAQQRGAHVVDRDNGAREYEPFAKK